ncbi:hypothetical protein BDV10DRAFT_189062 [Aspergillus recurvatus]
MSSTIYIGDLNKGDLIAALWSRSKPAAFFAMSGLPAPSFDKEDALRDAEKFGWTFDYLQGRVIKSDLSGNEVNPWGYDRDNGDGAFKEVVESLRNKGKGVAKDKAGPKPATASFVTAAASAPTTGTSVAPGPHASAATPANTTGPKNPKQSRGERRTGAARFFCF